MNNKIIVGLVVIALLLGGVGAFKQAQNTTVVKEIIREAVAGISSPDIPFLTFFRSGVVIGGSTTATSTTGSVVPLLATDFDDEQVIDVTLNLVDATLSFPSSSTIRNLNNPGDTKELYIRNASTTATMDLTITGGTGVIQKNATTTNIIAGDTGGDNYAVIRLIRKPNTDIESLVDIFLDD